MVDIAENVEQLLVMVDEVGHMDAKVMVNIENDEFVLLVVDGESGESV